MARFNFTNITLQSRANITDVMDNFTKIENLAALNSDLTSAVSTLNGSITANSNKIEQLKAVATTSANGMMSSTDKSKLDGIAANANNYSLPTASSTLGGVKTTSTVSSPSGYTACPIIAGVPYYKDTDTTYGVATTSANGLMSSAMVTKLNGIAENANNYSLPTASSTLGGVKTTSTVSSPTGYTACPIISGVPYYQNTTYNNATTSAAGLMSSSDKTKLNGIDNGATANTVIDNLTSTSATACLSANQGKILKDTVDTLNNTKQALITSGTNAPSGGSNGDIYLRYIS